MTLYHCRPTPELAVRTDDPVTQYMREKYPESWALAAQEAMEE